MVDGTAQAEALAPRLQVVRFVQVADYIAQAVVSAHGSQLAGEAGTAALAVECGHYWVLVAVAELQQC